MHKLIYLLTPDPDDTRAAMVARVMQAGARLAALGPAGLRINVQDAGVDWGDAVDHHPALKLKSEYGPFEAVVQIWLDDAGDIARSPHEAIISQLAPLHHGYLVKERLLVHNLRQSARPGDRNDGYSQMAVLQIPDWLDEAEWRQRWQGRHSWVAISIHPHLEYIQNRVLRAVTAGAPPITGIGEEAFPIEGLHDERPLFRGGEKSEAKFKELYEIMYEDASRFIDFGKLDMLVSSQFDLVRPVR
ncbi:hypothetical protein [Sphingomonas turrisvirgatae]|uniref:EthD domain-containing protein n=1 Tax=Sphingomonas turrisvirgatae TaxID=1888892 RepID=A0A1E3LXG9_9SPHN|nr:hypothetical protein [Sphingomonas turrisvirgatae]ODP38419.1 hypothetical protein BFL28_13635 [Sphingomonas turrisvirgatae]